MTNKEVIKALECCISPECESCPYDGDDLLRPCNHNLMKDALDLINRQQAEIERLSNSAKQWEDTAKDLFISKEKQKAEIEHIGKLYNERTNLCEEQNRQLAELDLVLSNYPYIVFLRNGAVATKNYEEYSKLLSAISNEAIKEFAERLTDKAELVRVNAFDSKWAISDEDIDNLVKEMVGEQG